MRVRGSSLVLVVSTTDGVDVARVRDSGQGQDAARAVGLVPTLGRGDLPLALLHGESLVSLATSALTEAGVALRQSDVTWTAVRDSAMTVVLHDPLCPLTPAAFIRDAIGVAAGGAVAVGVRPVTDTIKTVAGDVVGETVDRDYLWTVTSPVVLPPTVVSALADEPDLTDFAALVTSLREEFEVVFVEAPSLGRRVEDVSALLLLEAFAEVQRT